MPGESPAAHAERLARAKAAEVAARHPDAFVLAGDTVVTLDGRVVGKPRGEDDAVRTLLSLSGRGHEVITGLALALPADRLLSRVDRARVVMRAFGHALARAYVSTKEPLDKAGGYGIQGRGAALVERVEGDYYTVVGLPVAGLIVLLEAGGLRYTFDGLRRYDEEP